MIAFRCRCGKHFQVTDDLAGKQGTCPQCQQPIVVPNAASGPSPKASPSSGSGGNKLGFLSPPQQPDEMGRLGAYRVLQVLGSGGMGMVLQAEDPVLKRAIALKVMLPEVAADKLQRQRFLREAQATAAIEHDHIVVILQVGEGNGVPFIAMPFLKGEPLDVRLARDGRLPVAECVRIGRETAEGLAAAHARGLIHRDVKPANLWLEAPKGRVKIVDFGLARSGADDGHLTKSGAILGTPAFMAPEQARCQAVDGRCDLFSLGAVLYLMLTGQRPFQGHDAMSMLTALMVDTPRPVRELNPEVPPALAALVMRMLAKEPAQRPASAQAVADALAALEEDKTLLLDRRAGGLCPPVVAPNQGANAPRSPGRRVLTGLLFLLRQVQRLYRIPGRPGWIIKGATALVVLLLVLFLLKPGPGPSDTTPRDRAELAKEIVNSLGMTLVPIRPGKFKMGSPADEPGHRDDEQLHDVEITQPFYMAAHDVTVGQFRAFVKQENYKTTAETEGGASVWTPNLGWQLDPKANWQNPSFAQTDKHPVVSVSWVDAVRFCDWLSQKEGRKYALPTEAQWEYCCRAGTRTIYSFGGEPDILHAWINSNAGGKTHPVGQLRANAWGLYDMNGNIWQWTADWYDKDYYKMSPLKDPPGPSAGAARVQRGGGWRNDVSVCRAAHRDGLHAPADRFSSFGFRVVLLGR